MPVKPRLLVKDPIGTGAWRASIPSYRTERVLHIPPPRLDTFIGGLRSSTVTLIEGSHPFLSDLIASLCVQAVIAFDENVVFVDGGNSIAPYVIADFSKRAGLEMGYVLSKINVCRAFTAYQMSTVLGDRLRKAVEDCDPSLLIVSGIANFFLDGGMGKCERVYMLERGLLDIGDLTRKYGLITVLTDPLGACRHGMLQSIIYGSADEVLGITARRKGIRLHMLSDGMVMDYCPVPSHQTTLDEFNGRCDDGTYTAYI